jgi:CheY-like chemotaxis protein
MTPATPPLETKRLSRLMAIAHTGLVRGSSTATALPAPVLHMRCRAVEAPANDVPIVLADCHAEDRATVSLKYGDRLDLVRLPHAHCTVIAAAGQVRHALRRGLKLMGYAIETASDGADGSAKIEVWRPDVVLLDLAMPRTGGLRALEVIRTSSSLPIIVLSVMDEEADKVRALDGAQTTT